MNEHLELNNFVLIGQDGKEFKIDGLTTTILVSDETKLSNEENELYATIKNTDTIECEFETSYISTKSLLALLIGDNKRTIRRALRWYEKLRRMEIENKIKFGNRIVLAAQCAKFKGNNRKDGKQK